MEALDIALEPGFGGEGTRGQNRGRWFEGNLARFYGERALGPWGGWRLKSGTLLTGACRAAFSWRADNALSWLALGTHSRLYVMSESGAVSDVTPLGFVAGRADAVTAAGYGRGAYGAGAYGAPRPSTSSVQPASMHTLDSWGQDLIGVMGEDGRPFIWQRDPLAKAAFIAGAPTCEALFVTAERAVMALGADGNNRRARWSDWENLTGWTPSATNKAGDQDLQTSGELLFGKVLRGNRNLIVSSQDAWVVEKRAGLLVYEFVKIGDGCGAVSRGSGVVLGDGRCIWMGQERFWAADGGRVSPVPCSVADRIFSAINTAQASKITAVHDSALGVARWFYPSSSATEVDSYVEFDYVRGRWTDGRIARLCGVDRGVGFDYPLLVGSDGRVFEHEVGAQYDGATPFARAQVRLGDGRRRLTGRYLIPDERVLGQVQVFVRARAEVMSATAQESGPYTLRARTPVRFTGREIEMEYRFTTPDPDSRVGDFRLLCQPRGER